MARPGPHTRSLPFLLFLPAILFLCAAVAAGAVRILASGAEDHARRKHGHLSLRGGLVQPIGNSHVELLLEEGGGIRLFVLGEDEAELLPVPLSELVAHVLPGGASAAVPVTLRAEPQPGETRTAASCFAGRLPPELDGAPALVTLTIPVEGRSYRARFDLRELARGHAGGGDGAEMPAGAGEAEARRLHLTPGGLYTEADIRANGRTTPAEKFRGIRASHDRNPAPGERICPITSTKADPRFAWSIGGREYLFCCPPCIDEFVQRARDEPGSILPPEDYAKR